MLNGEKSGLLIFDNFQIDFNLPKWKARSEWANGLGGPPTINPFPILPRINRRDGNFVSGGVGFQPLPSAQWAGGISTGVSGVSGSEQKPSLWDRIFHRKKIKKAQEEAMERMQKPNFTVEILEPKEETQKMTVEEFFSSVKNSAEELNLVKERFKNYESAIEHLKKTGQVFLIEQMEQDLEIHSAETKLYAIGLRKVVTEKNIVDFAKKSPRALKLDWIQNFARLIPGKVIDVKMNADEKHIFDNYCVLHFDPDNKGSQQTNAEKAKAKDPILFGVIAGSTKLYYVAAWIDEFCDLTFDKLVETLGEEAIKANDLTTEIKIG